MQNHIFRKSDIRGQIDIDFSVADAYILTKAIVYWFIQQNKNLERIAIAFDGRVHGQALYQQVSKAIIDSGYQVYFLGICPTPVLEFALYHVPVQAAIMITASGSGVTYNGFKLYENTKLVQDQDLQEIANHYQKQDSITSAVPSKIIPCPILEQYIDYLWQEFSHLSEYDFSLVIDCGQSSTSLLIKKLIQKMGWKKVITICDVIDSSFSIHDPEPFELKNLMHLQTTVLKYKTMFGIAFDGDGDRLVICDHKATIIKAQDLALIFAQDMIQKQKSFRLALDSDFQEQFNNELMGKKIVCSSRFQIEQALHYNQAQLGVQNHGRFFFKDRHKGYPDGIYTLLRLLEILVQKRATLQDLLQKDVTIKSWMSESKNIQQHFTES